MDNILEGLNDKQKEAATTTEGPLLILAGPGSGKTKTIAHRIAYMINQGIGAEQILAVTFTNKAAGELKSRVSGLVSGRPPVIGTFHSICARILRRETDQNLPYSTRFTIYDEDDQASLLKKIIKEDFSLDPKQVPPKKVKAIISSLKDELKTPDLYAEEAEGSSNPFYRKVSKIYTLYQEKLRGNDALDFADLLLQTVILLQSRPAVARKYQQKFRYLLIDEYQDTNTAQYVLSRLLAQEHNNICVVGDDAQAIYGWRNADFRNILNFELHWPQTKIVKLEQNYRSTQKILDAASAIIKNNSQQKEKALWTQNKKGEKLRIKEVSDEKEEGDFIAEEIERLTAREKFAFKDCVILYRTNAQSRAIEEAFLRHDLPYKIIGGIKFYQRKEVKDILGWLRLCVNPRDTSSLGRLNEIPIRFLISNSKFLISKQFPNSQIPKQKNLILNALVTLFHEKSKELPLVKLIKYVVDKSGYEQYIRDGTEKGEERWENVQELVSVAAGHNNLEQFLQEVALAQEADEITEYSDQVHLMTLHLAKGLEYPVVFIAGMEEGLLPHSSTLLLHQQDELEEERRLCYVGITRAKQKAYLVFTRHRMRFGSIQSNPASRFLEEIPEKLVKFEPAEEETIIDL